MFQGENQDQLLRELGCLLASAVNLSNPNTQGRLNAPLETSFFFYEETALDLMKAAMTLLKGLQPTHQDLLTIQETFLDQVQPLQASAMDVWDQLLYQCQLHSTYQYQ